VHPIADLAINGMGIFIDGTPRVYWQRSMRAYASSLMTRSPSGWQSEPLSGARQTSAHNAD